MSRIYKVIILNKPVKIFDFTPAQLAIMAVAIVFGLIISTKVPGDWKVQHIPGGVLLFIFILCAAIVFVKASEVKSYKWWINLFLYKANLVPRTFVPKPEPGHVYPSPDIIEPGKAEDQYYIEAKQKLS